MEVTESSDLLLPFAAASVGVARRRLVSDLINAGVCGSAVTDAALVLSELLSNALCHATPLAGPGLRVGWSLEADSIRVSVTDGGAQTVPELGEPSMYTTGGRGLRIVERLSLCWGTRHDNEGTTVWAEVPVPQVATIGVSAAAAERG